MTPLPGLPDEMVVPEAVVTTTLPEPLVVATMALAPDEVTLPWAVTSTSPAAPLVFSASTPTPVAKSRVVVCLPRLNVELFEGSNLLGCVQSVQSVPGGRRQLSLKRRPYAKLLRVKRTRELKCLRARVEYDAHGLGRGTDCGTNAW